MPEPGTAALAREARVFARALTGETPTAYAAAQYARAHEHLALHPAGAFDRRLAAFAAAAPWAARAADAYARWFAPRAALRRKLVVLAAILESSPPHDAAFDPVTGSAAGIILRLALAGAGFVLALLVGLLVLTPVRLVSALGGDGG